MNSSDFIYPALITVISLIVYLVLSVNVGRARMRYKIMPPATTGNADFDRYYRVQQNTVEQIIMFLPVLWTFAVFVSPLWASIIGVFWPIGRIVFALGYYKNAESRKPGFAITVSASLILLIGSLIGIIRLLVGV